MVRKIVIAAIAAFAFCSSLSAASISKRDFWETIDSLSVLMEERTGVKVKLVIKSISARGSNLDFTFTETLGDYPWRKEDLDYFRENFRGLFPEKYASYGLGSLKCKSERIEDYIMEDLGYSGQPTSSKFRTEDRRETAAPLVKEIGGKDYNLGLSGRHIALWQSHGWYYDNSEDRWKWQRAPLFGTVEDVFTQSFVLPFLVPMLENAGAVTILPRERDCSTFEKVIDPCEDNKWSADIEKKGRYSVYVSYKTSPESSSKAIYSIKHKGGTSEIAVNQKMGGGIWIHLGEFDFDDRAEISLRNAGKEGSKISAGKVKIGGGIGVSGRPRFVEGAKYWMEYAGVDSTVWYQNCGENDYRDDFMSRGAWVSYLSAGSKANPGSFIPPKDGNKNQPANRPGLNIPIDLSLAFHSDAGIFQKDTIVGTLAIYTLRCEDKDVQANGEKRLSHRQLADIVQSQAVNDIRASFEPEWTRRETWDRSYSESRTASVPALLLESLSHQNFADMKYGLDPSFRFTLSRAVYKGILKFLSNRYGCKYAVQPLPVQNFAAILQDGNTVRLSWAETPDTLEPTAQADKFILYTRIDDGVFDKGIEVDGCNINCTLEPGHLYSWKVVACNEGGKSFPSEILSAGIPLKSKGKILVVNNFTRVSGPYSFESEDCGWFDWREDSGVPYIRDISYIGEMYERRKDSPFISNDAPGFGASFDDCAGKVTAGNTFDYPSLHGKAIMDAGYSFSSCSAKAYTSDAASGCLGVDIICGKQKTTVTGHSKPRFKIFTEDFTRSLRETASKGVNILISGSYIACDGVIPSFLGYKFCASHAGRKGTVNFYGSSDYVCNEKSFAFNTKMREEIYSVENPCGIAPEGKNAKTVYRYSDTGISAGICNKGIIGDLPFKTVCLGFPIETITDKDVIDDIISSTLKYFEAK